VGAVREWAAPRDEPAVNVVRFVLFGEDTLAAFAEALEA
jgi:O-acetyl-ADP-ribose deacetylase (regulator of RNase III)